MKFCTKCGAQLPDEAKFCTTCGQKMETPIAETVAETPFTPAPAVEAPVTPVAENYVAPATENFVTETLGNETPTDPFTETPQYYQQPDQFVPVVPEEPKKVRKPFNVKKFLLKVCLPIALVAAIVVGILLSPALGAVLKLTSPKSYFTYVENKAFDTYADSVSGIYGTALNNIKPEGYGVSSKLTFTLGDDAKTLLKDTVDLGNVNLDWLSSVSFTVDGSFVEQKVASGIGLMIGDVSIISFNSILDYAEKEGYINLGDLFDKSIKVSLDDAFEDVDLDPSMLSSIMKSAKAALPSAEFTKKIITKYAKTAYSEFKDIKKSTETVEVAGVSQKLTVLTITIDSHSVMNAIIAVLEDVAKDKEIKDYFYKFMDSDIAKYLVAFSSSIDKESLYQQFQTGIKSAITNMKNELAETPKQTVGVLYDYVNNSHEIVGRKVEISGNVIADYVTVQKGSDFATNAAFYADETINMLGTGKKSGDTIKEGSYVFSYDGEQYVEAKVKDLNTKGFEKGELKGEITLSASSALVDEFDSDVKSVFNSINPSIQLKFDTNTKTSALEVNVLKGDALFFGVTMKSEMTKPKAIDVPTDNVVDAEDENDIMALLGDINLDTLKSRLKQAGVPAELINLLDSIGGQQKVPAAPSYGTGSVFPSTGFGY